MQLDSEDIDAYGLVEWEGSDWDHSQIGSYSSEFKLENNEPEKPEEEVHEALEMEDLVSNYRVASVVFLASV